MSDRSVIGSVGPASPESRSLSALLSCMIDQLEVAIVLVDITSLKLVWTSTASSRLDNRLIAGNSLNDLPELLSVLRNALQSSLDNSRERGIDEKAGVSVCYAPQALDRFASDHATQLTDSSLAYGLGMRITVSPTGDVPCNKAEVSCDVCRHTACKQVRHLMLRLEPEQIAGGEHRRYAAERNSSLTRSGSWAVNEMVTNSAGDNPLSAKAQKFAEQLNSLTPREAEVLELLLQGYANKQCAYELRISVRTVELHRARLLRKLCVRSGAELIRAVLIHRAG